MKKQVLKIAKELGIEVSIESEKEAFDVINYTISIGNHSDVFQYFTGKTSTGVSYPFDKVEFLERVKHFITRRINQC
jgi:hypothetical protein